MARLGKQTHPQRNQGIPWDCPHGCRGYKGDHTRDCPITRRRIIDSLEMHIRWDESDLAETDPARAITDSKVRNKILARIARRQKTLARLQDRKYDRVTNDRRRALDTLARLERMGGNQ